jgi:hypothetical protein
LQSPDIVDFLHGELMQRTSDLDGLWQTYSQKAPIWEMGGTQYGVERDRMAEIAGLMASVGERLALARSALTECELWTRRRKGNDQAGDEMCHPAMAELLMYFCIGTGHGLANLTGRLVALDNRMHGLLVDRLGTVLPPHSNDHRAWISPDIGTLRQLRHVAKQAKSDEARGMPDAMSSLVTGHEWTALLESRAIDFHRRRPQSFGVLGVPNQTLWDRAEDGVAVSISAGLPPYNGASQVDRDHDAHWACCVGCARHRYEYVARFTGRGRGRNL